MKFIKTYGKISRIFYEKFWKIFSLISKTFEILKKMR